MDIVFDLDVIARVAEREGVSLYEAEQILARAVGGSEEGDE